MLNKVMTVSFRATILLSVLFIIMLDSSAVDNSSAGDAVKMVCSLKFLTSPGAVFMSHDLLKMAMSVCNNNIGDQTKISVLFLLTKQSFLILIVPIHAIILLSGRYISKFNAKAYSDISRDSYGRHFTNALGFSMPIFLAGPYFLSKASLIEAIGHLTYQAQ